MKNVGYVHTVTGEVCWLFCVHLGRVFIPPQAPSHIRPYRCNLQAVLSFTRRRRHARTPLLHQTQTMLLSIDLATPDAAQAVCLPITASFPTRLRIPSEGHCALSTSSSFSHLVTTCAPSFVFMPTVLVPSVVMAVSFHVTST